MSDAIMDRKTVLLMACRDMLIKCRDSDFVESPMEITVHYDEADCDGSCLLDDIEVELEKCVADTKEGVALQPTTAPVGNYGGKQ